VVAFTLIGIGVGKGGDRFIEGVAFSQVAADFCRLMGPTFSLSVTTHRTRRERLSMGYVNVIRRLPFADLSSSGLHVLWRNDRAEYSF